MDNQPLYFSLGTGHVKFFYNKLLYLKKRYEDLFNECRKRNFNVTYFGSAWHGIPKEYMNDYIPTERDANIVQARLYEKNTLP